MVYRCPSSILTIVPHGYPRFCFNIAILVSIDVALMVFVCFLIENRMKDVIGRVFLGDTHFEDNESLSVPTFFELVLAIIYSQILTFPKLSGSDNECQEDVWKWLGLNISLRVSWLRVQQANHLT